MTSNLDTQGKSLPSYPSHSATRGLEDTYPIRINSSLNVLYSAVLFKSICHDLRSVEEFEVEGFRDVSEGEERTDSGKVTAF